MNPLGKANVGVMVEVCIVDDSVLDYPVLPGHSFIEMSNITITEMPNELIFENTLRSKTVSGRTQGPYDLRVKGDLQPIRLNQKRSIKVRLT